MVVSYGKVSLVFIQLDHNLVQYEWVESENRWVKFFDNDPEPPVDLPPGKFDGQIIDVEKDG